MPKITIEITIEVAMPKVTIEITIEVAMPKVTIEITIEVAMPKVAIEITIGVAMSKVTIEITIEVAMPKIAMKISSHFHSPFHLSYSLAAVRKEAIAYYALHPNPQAVQQASLTFVPLQGLLLLDKGEVEWNNKAAGIESYASTG